MQCAVNSLIDAFIGKKSDVFEGLRKFNITYSIKIDSNIQPITRHPMRIRVPSDMHLIIASLSLIPL